MNGYLGLNHPYTGGYKMMTKTAHIRKPSKTFVFLEEREDSINDGWFAVDMGGYDPRSSGSFTIVDYPASYNNGSCAFAFTDGHAEFRKWVDPRTVPKLRPGHRRTWMASIRSHPVISTLWNGLKRFGRH